MRAASGTGFAVSFSGHIVTNHHVAKGCNSVRINKKGNSYRARVVAIDRINDLALLASNLKPKNVLPLNPKNPQLLEEVFVAGYPFGKRLGSSLKITKGIVSSI